MTTTAFLGPDPGGPVVDGRRTRGNELVVWIDDEKRRDLFADSRRAMILAPTRTARDHISESRALSDGPVSIVFMSNSKVVFEALWPMTITSYSFQVASH